jgi:HEAT repeat protein
MTEGGFSSPVPAARINAIEAASRANDRSAIPQIVEALTSDDAAVRFTAIAALQRMTGETFGYRAEDTAVDRRKSVALWVNAVKSDSVPQAPTGDARG